MAKDLSKALAHCLLSRKDPGDNAFSGWTDILTIEFQPYHISPAETNPDLLRRLPAEALSSFYSPRQLNLSIAPYLYPAAALSHGFQGNGPDILLNSYHRQSMNFIIGQSDMHFLGSPAPAAVSDSRSNSVHAPGGGTVSSKGSSLPLSSLLSPLATQQGQRLILSRRGWCMRSVSPRKSPPLVKALPAVLPEKTGHPPLCGNLP